jgi:hypothetical protein
VRINRVLRFNHGVSICVDHDCAVSAAWIDYLLLLLILHFELLKLLLGVLLGRVNGLVEHVASVLDVLW